MIKYALRCAFEHEFDAWFSSSDDYELQLKAGQVQCPYCNTSQVGKAIMAPNIVSSKSAQRHISEVAEFARLAASYRAHIEKTCDYVGKDFPEVARDMHDGLIPEKPIYGEASLEEAKTLIDEGIKLTPVPPASFSETQKLNDLSAHEPTEPKPIFPKAVNKKLS